MSENATENMTIYECQTCGELVPLGCCTCGPQQRLRVIGSSMLGGKEMYIRKVETFEIRSDDSKVVYWRGTKEELTILLGDDEWHEDDTVVFARLGAILASQRIRVKGAGNE